MPKEKMVRIEWDDASYNSGYYNKDKPQDYMPVPTSTVGHLVKSNRKTIIVSQDRFYKGGKIDDDRYLGIIPKKMIKRITVLGEVNASKD